MSARTRGSFHIACDVNQKTIAPAFKADAVKLAGSGNKTLEQVAKQLDVLPPSLREWVARAAPATVAADGVSS